MNATQALVGQETTLTLRTYADGTQQDLGTVTIGVVDANGTEVVASGTAVTDNSDGSYSYTLAAQDAPCRLKATWTVTSGPSFITFVEVVSNVLFTIPNARAAKYTGGVAALSNDTTYPDDAIAQVRAKIRDQFEDRTGIAWAARYCRTEVAGNDSHRLSLHRGRHRDNEGRPLGGPAAGRPTRLLSVTVNGQAVDLDGVHVDGYHLIRPVFGWPCSFTDPFNIIVEYEYGPDPVPFEAHEHALRTAVATLVPSDVSGYAQSFNSQDGVVNFAPTEGLVYPSRTWEWLKKHARVYVG